jgi:hypothetical protein
MVLEPLEQAGILAGVAGLVISGVLLYKEIYFAFLSDQSFQSLLFA